MGLWGAILGGCYTGYFYCSLEFRTDNLWAPLWLLAMLVLISGRMSTRLAFLAGFLFSFCFAISMKSALLLLVVFSSAGISYAMAHGKPGGETRREVFRCAAAFLLAVPIVPAVIMAAFVLGHAWPEFRYCVFQHNILPGVDNKNHPAIWSLLFPIALPFVLYAGRRIIRAAPERTIGFRRGFVFLFCGIYFIALYSFWTLLTRQDFLPFHPLAFVFYTAALLVFSEWLVQQRTFLGGIFRRWPVPALVAAIELVFVFTNRPLTFDGTKRETNVLRAILRLTNPSDYVFDCKGETVFRRRCFYYVLEPFTLVRMQRHLIVNDIARRCVATGTCVAVIDFGQITFTTRKFLLATYLPVTRDVRVAGCILKPPPFPGSPITFNTVIPASYRIVSAEGTATGMLDGSAMDAARFLAPGKPVLSPRCPAERSRRSGRRRLTAASTHSLLNRMQISALPACASQLFCYYRAPHARPAPRFALARDVDRTASGR